MKKPNRYFGKLNAAQAAQGINGATQNAKRLLEDAKLLLEAGRYPSAASLAILAIEEVGKRDILRWLSLLSTSKQIANQWRDYRTHTKKNVLWPFNILADMGANQVDDFQVLFRQGATHPLTLDAIKQVGIYTDCFEGTHWSIPDQAIGEDLTRLLVSIAQDRATDQEVTEKEMELWIKHLSYPAKVNDRQLFEKALIDWFAEMQKLGLAEQGNNMMEEFLRRG